MSDIMTPTPFPKLMDRILQEHKKGSCERQEALVPAAFGVRKCYKADPNRHFTFFGRKLETQIGPAAGPNTQLAQNIVASYYGGARFFELKTVQKMDGRELAAAVHKPCILAEDEGYNCEWSTELTVQQAGTEYIKAWFVLKVISKEWGLGSPDGFQFNISVGYDLEGIKGPKVNTFIDNMMNAGSTPVYQECKAWLRANLSRFAHITEADVDAIGPDIVNSATVSTLHGCPPQEIEAIASYLLTEKGLHTFIKCNPTLLGYEEARKTLDSMGYGYIQFTDVHFRGDLQYADAIPMLTRLQKLADSKGLEFGVKITNTFPVDVTRNELPSAEMYMSGKSLYPLSLRVARNLSRDFGGKLRISFSGGCDFFNIAKVIGVGIWPVTMATTILKPGGYERLVQMAEKLSGNKPEAWQGIDVPALEALADAARTPASRQTHQAAAQAQIRGKGAAGGLLHRPLLGPVPHPSGHHGLWAARGRGQVRGGPARHPGKEPAPLHHGEYLHPHLPDRLHAEPLRDAGADTQQQAHRGAEGLRHRHQGAEARRGQWEEDRHYRRGPGGTCGGVFPGTGRGGRDGL